jgi:hypothetical protein
MEPEDMQPFSSGYERPDEPAAEENHPEDRPVQFGLRTLFILQLICATFLVLFRYWGIVALAIGMAATLIYQWIPAEPEHWRLKRFIVDLLGGVILPLFCLAYDPGIFVEGGALSVTAWLAVVFQMGVILTWLLVGPWLRRASSYFAGLLSGGAGIAFLIQLPLLPISLIGLIVGLGIVGFTPTLTGLVFWRNFRSAWRLGKRVDGPRAKRRFCLGLLLALLVPLVLYAVCGQWLPQVIRWLPQVTGAKMGPLG